MRDQGPFLKDEVKAIEEVLKMEKRGLGICLGARLMAQGLLWLKICPKT